MSSSDVFGLVGRNLDGRFQIRRAVAEGGFGVVYLGQQLALDRAVAIKVLKNPAHLDAAAQELFRAKFAEEAKTIARLKHPNIVDVYDFGISQMPSGTPSPWMALEWLDGQTLEEQLAGRRHGGGRSPAETMELLRPVLRAFAVAHRQGIVHRDIKPANVMSVPGEGGEHLRVLDFGIAKLMLPDETAGTGRTRTAGLYAFSPAYASPEQVSGARTGPWTDVHALALLLTEVLTDLPAFTSTDVLLYSQIVKEERPTPASKGFDVGAWEDVLKQALHLQPSQRHRDAAALLAALEQALPGAKHVAAGGGKTVALASTLPAGASPPTGSTSAAFSTSVPLAPPVSRTNRRVLAGGAAAAAAVVGAVLYLRDPAPRQPAAASPPAAMAARPHPSGPAMAPPPAPAPAPPPPEPARAAAPDAGVALARAPESPPRPAKEGGGKRAKPAGQGNKEKKRLIEIE